MNGPFDGLTVVEFGQFVVVPFCSQLMADAGARVIKVEPPTGDNYRSWPAQLAPNETRQFLIKNRGKQSVSIDLSHPDSAQVVRALIEAADVVLVNLSPSAVTRRGLDYESVAKMNPRVVYGAVTAYGQVGPEAPLPGMDVVVQARSGLLMSLGAERDGVPLHSEVQVADYSAAILLFGGIASALYVREKTGIGQSVEVSLLGGALTVQNNSLGHVHGADKWREEFVKERLPALRKAGASGAVVESERRQLRPDPPSHTSHYRVFRASDGFIAVGAGSAGARRRLSAAIGLEQEVGAQDPAEFGRQLEAALLERTSKQWVTVLVEAGVPVAEVRHVDELLFDTHVAAEGLIADYEHPVVGRYRALGSPIRMSATPITPGAASPSFAHHTVEILRELRFTDDEIGALCSRGAVLDGTGERGALGDPVDTARSH